jgi:hypothetical protein
MPTGRRFSSVGRDRWTPESVRSAWNSPAKKLKYLKAPKRPRLTTTLRTTNPVRRGRRGSSRAKPIHQSTAVVATMRPRNFRLQ